MDINTKFKECQNILQRQDKINDTNTLLKLYGLYKQATIGNNIDEEPNIIYFRDYCKWESWNKYRNLTKKEAKTKFIEFTNTLSI